MKKLFLAWVVVAITIGLTSCAGNDSPAISYDGAFEMLTMVETNKNHIFFAIRDKDGLPDDHVKFCTIPYASRWYGIKAFWANKNNDFFLLSSDFGVQTYIYKDNTWDPGYMIEITEVQPGEYSARLVQIPIEDEEEISFEYDVENVPQAIIDYLVNLPIDMDE